MRKTETRILCNKPTKRRKNVTENLDRIAKTAKQQQTPKRPNTMVRANSKMKSEKYLKSKLLRITPQSAAKIIPIAKAIKQMEHEAHPNRKEEVIFL